jgi:predicted metal-binding protein
VEPPVILLLCSTCAGERRADQDAIDQALNDQGLSAQVQVALVACMGACEQPVSVGLQGAGRASYVFADVSPQQDAGDIARTCETYLNSPAGWIEDARPCGRLRDCLRARLPAIGAVPEPLVDLD